MKLANLVIITIILIVLIVYRHVFVLVDVWVPFDCRDSDWGTELKSNKV